MHPNITYHDTTHDLRRACCYSEFPMQWKIRRYLFAPSSGVSHQLCGDGHSCITVSSEFIASGHATVPLALKSRVTKQSRKVNFEKSKTAKDKTFIPKKGREYFQHLPEINIKPFLELVFTEIAFFMVCTHLYFCSPPDVFFDTKKYCLTKPGYLKKMAKYFLCSQMMFTNVSKYYLRTEDVENCISSLSVHQVGQRYIGIFSS